MARARIMVVEDEPGLLEVLALNLRASGYEVIGVSDGLEALRRFDEARPDLVTLDLNMPTVSGFRLLHLFKQERAVPVVVLTGYSFEEAEEVAHGGADDFLTKPVEFPQLLSKIERALQRYADV
ncbi:MAG: response regulator [Chloroflexi bacterium]|nr:response regulator [Chloroflexota bacterium]